MGENTALALDAKPVPVANANAPSRRGIFSWYGASSGPERRTFWSCYLGHILDAMDNQFYNFAIPALLAEWSLTRGQAGQILTATLLTSAIGGWLAGILADRIGRVRVLVLTIGWFAACSLLSAFTQNYWQLLGSRALLGFGFGGETAISAILIAEAIHTQARGRAVGIVQSGWAIGSMAAVILASTVFSIFPDQLAWRVLFGIGFLPALLIFFISRTTKEPETFRRMAQSRRAGERQANPMAIFSRSLLPTTILTSLVASGILGGNFALNTWLPTFLKTARHLSVMGTGGYVLVQNVGALCGYLFGAYLADRVGRKRTFVIFACSAMVTLVLYTIIPISDAVMLVLGFPLGFFSSGILAGIGSFFAELFPTELRGSGQGFAFNVGRAVGALFPLLVGLLGDRISLGHAIGTIGLIPYVVLLIALIFLPETRGRELDERARE